MPPLLRYALAVLAPLAVFGGAWTMLAAEEPTELGDLAVEFDKRVTEARNADVVVVGASFAHSDFDKGALASALGTKRALILSCPSSSAPIWYAILKERVYGNGLKPGLVVIPASVPTALTVRLLPAQAQRLTDQMPVPDDVVLARSYGALLPAKLQQVLDRRATLRDPLLEQFRTSVPRLLVGADPNRVANAGTAVFGEQHASADARAIPVVEARAAAAQDTSLAVEDPHDSYLADLADLVEEHGGQLAIVLPPQAPGVTRSYAAAVEAALVDWANERGVGWLDLRQLGWDATRFSDDLHMTPDSAKAFSTLVGERLASMGALSGGRLAAATAPLVPVRVARIGAPPPLPATTSRPGKEPCVEVVEVPGLEFLGWGATGRVAAGIRSPLVVWEGDKQLEARDGGTGCSGTWRQKDQVQVRRIAAEGPPLRVGWSESVPVRTDKEEFYWVYPGTSLRWDFDRSWSAGAVVAAEVLAFGGAAAMLTVGGSSAAFSPSGARLRAVLPAPSGDGAWNISIRSPPDGAFLLVRRLRAEAGDSIASIVAEPAPHAIDVLNGPGLVVDGVPPAVGPFPSGSGDRTGWFVVPKLGFGNCTPFRVWKGDRPLDRATLAPRNGAPPGIGGTRQVGDRLYFALSEGSAAEMSVRLDDDRSCLAAATKGGGVSTWLYAGDHARVEVAFPRRFALGGDVLRLLVRGDPLQIEHGPVQIGLRATVGAGVVVDRQLDLASLPPTLTVPLDQPVPISEKKTLILELTMPPGAPPTLVRVRITDGGA